MVSPKCPYDRSTRDSRCAVSDRCCRYPFHLRPKNRQAFQYLQMAVEIINDLELDQDPEPENRSLNVSDERLENIRTFLAAYYLVCT